MATSLIWYHPGQGKPRAPQHVADAYDSDHAVKVLERYGNAWPAHVCIKSRMATGGVSFGLFRYKVTADAWLDRNDTCDTPILEIAQS
jgi:hypothetical protein